MDFELDSEKPKIVDLNILNTHNEFGCQACNQKFNLGETVVMACGAWQDGCARLIHERDAVFDPSTRTWYERKYFQSLKH